MIICELSDMCVLCGSFLSLSEVAGSGAVLVSMSHAPYLDPRIDTIISLRQGPKEAHGWVDVRDVLLLSSSGGIPLDTVTTLLKKLKFFEFVGLSFPLNFPNFLQTRWLAHPEDRAETQNRETKPP